MKLHHKVALGIGLASAPVAVVSYSELYDGNIGTVLNDWAHHPTDTYHLDRMTLGCRGLNGRLHHENVDNFYKTRSSCREGLSELHESEEFRFGAGGLMALTLIAGVSLRRKK
jgi:hypothetical protein